MRLPTLRHTYSYQNAEEGKHKCSICEDEQAHKMNVVVGSYNEETDEHTLKCSDCTYTETSKEHTYDQEDGSCACGAKKPPQEISVTYDITTIAEDNSWVSETQYLTLPSNDSNVSITAQNGGGNTGKYYEASKSNAPSWRIYATKSSQGQVVVSVLSGYSLKSVTISYDKKETGNNLQASDSNKSTITSGEEYTVNDANKQSITFTVQGSSGHAKIYSITVVYTQN